MKPQPPHKILLVGYSPFLRGGITKVTSVLLPHILEVELFVAMRFYRPLSKQIWFTVCAYFRFLARLFKRQPQIVHVVVGSAGDLIRNIVFVVLAKLFLCRVLVQFHTNRDHIFSRLPFVITVLVLRAYRLANVFCFLSHHLELEMRRDFPKKGCRIVIPNPTEDSYFAVPPIPRSRRTKEAIFLGRWTQEKGCVDLQAAMSKVFRSTDVSCRCFGEGIPNNIGIGCLPEGWIEGPHKRDIIAKAHLLVLPSYAEAFPNVLIEAAACGTPFVATRVGGVIDIVSESHAGLIVEVGDVDGLARCMLKLLQDSECWDNLSQNGRAWAQSLRVCDIANRWRCLYSNLAEKKLPVLTALHGNPDDADC